jgi:hypothetical protein
MAVYILNRSPTKALNGRMTYEAWHERKPVISHLRVFGCIAFGKELGHISNLDDRSTPGVFIGYVEGSKAHLVGHSDSDHADDIDTSKSTSGILSFFSKCLVSWQLVKQQVVVMSSCEAEYIAASTALTQVLWVVRLLSDLLGRDTGAVELWVDSKSALALAKNSVFHEWSKHIRVRHHFIRGCLEEGSIKIGYINTKDQLANLLTKPLVRIRFLELCSKTGMVQISHKTTHKT